MHIQKLACFSAICVVFGLTHSVLAQPTGQTNYNWIAAGDKATWSQGANWDQGYPPPTNGTAYQINLGDFSGDSAVPIELASTNVVAINDSTFGPMWGQTLDIYGSYTCGWGMFVWGALNGPITTLNVWPNASLTCMNTLAFGTAWWFPGGPNAVMNVYSNAQVNVTWMQFGGRLNLYGGTVSVTNGFNTGTATAPVFSGGLDTDATRSINLTAGSTLVLPTNYTATVTDWISRGILQVYGVPGDTSEIVIDETNANWPDRTVVTTTATNASPMLALRLELPRTNLFVGGLEQAQVYADFTTSTNVNVTLTPGLGLVYQSSASNVVTVTAGGAVRATGAGSAQVTAVAGAFSNSVMVTVNLYTNTASLVHRYSFSDAPNSYDVMDSVPGNSPYWDGTAYGCTQTGSNVVLDGIQSYVEFPPGLVSNMDAVTIETWVSFSSISNWAPIFMFGDSDGTSGHNYISCQPHTGGASAQIGIRNASSELDAAFTPALDNYTNVEIAAVFDPDAGYLAIYTNGVLAVMNSSITITMEDAMSTGDPYNYIGRSLWSADPYLGVTMDEFRIYDGPLTAGQIRADAALGPNQLIGTSTNVSLAANVSGGSVHLEWPTTSALVTLQSSPALGADAVWTDVAVPMALNGGNYEVSIPVVPGSTRYFRLIK